MMERDSAHITYKEFFDLCDKSVEERTNLVVELRGLYPSVSNTTKDKLIEFLNAENDAVRAKRDLYRRQMLFTSAIDTTTETLWAALEEARKVQDYPSSAYGRDYYRERVKKTKQEMVEAAKELQSSATSFVGSYQRTLELEAGVADAATRSGIRFKAIFKGHSELNTNQGKNSSEIASEAIKQIT
jgi:hypothetical protein